MRFTDIHTGTVLTAVFLSVAIANPLTATPSTKNARTQSSVISGLICLRNAYRKYGASMPEDVASAAIQKRDGTVEADPTQYDTVYNVQVSVDLPSTVTTYITSVDTGSSAFTLYAPNLGKSGTVTETVNIGGVTVTMQTVTLSSDASGGSNEVGLSYAGKNFYTNAVTEGAIAPIFTAALNKGAPGRYNFGYIDSTEYKGSITYATVKTANSLWEIASNGYAVGSTAVVTASIDAVVDTGTTLLLLLQSVCAAFYKQVPGAVYSSAQGGYIFPCSSTLPSLTLVIGTYKAIVPGSYLNYAPLSTGSTTCFGGLQRDDGIGFSIFGLAFIKSQFVVFKGTTNPSVGFAAKP